MIEQAKFTYSLLGKTFEKQTKIIKDQGEKQTKALELLKFSNEINELKQLKGIFLDTQLTNLIKDRLKEIAKLQNSINLSGLNYLSNKKNEF